MKREKHRSPCPIATALDVIGDRWTLVVIRDLFLGKSKYQEFLTSPEKITTNILAQRLKYLEDEALVVKDLYQAHPPRFQYALTDKGKALSPVLSSLWTWSQIWEQEKAPKDLKSSPF